MVNGKISTKATILARLRYAPGIPVSGEVLAAEAKISRVAIWKAVEALRRAGYTLTGGEDGYRLDPEGTDDFLYPWEFGPRESAVHHWPETDSTMDRARELADRGAEDGTLAVAETQCAGRGRSGRRWASAAGGLFFTLIQRPRGAVCDYVHQSIALQIAVSRAVGALTGAAARLRWPNDVYVQGRKVAGVLSELRAEGDRLTWLTLGVGINVNNKVHGPDAVACSVLADRRISRRDLLNAVLREREILENEKAGPRELAALWNQLAEGRQHRVAVIDPRHGSVQDPNPGRARRAGRFLGIDSRGRAVLDESRGRRRYAPGAASLIFIP